MKKITSILCIVFAVIMVLALPTAAATPYYTYTYSISGEALISPEAYKPRAEINSDSMGLLNLTKLREIYPNLSDEELQSKSSMKLTGITDLETDELGNIYLVDKTNNRVIVLDGNSYTVKNIIDTFTNAYGVTDELGSPEGVFVTQKKTVNGQEIANRVFVCDTGKSRILEFDINGNFVKEIPKPESDLVSGTYSPIALVVDKYDRMYVIDRSSQNGVMVLTDDGDFTGYIGAQKVSESLWDKIWKRFQTEEQKEIAITEVADPYNNIALAGDFIYVTISPSDTGAMESSIKGKDKSGDNAPVKLLNAAGSELMRRNGFYPPSGEVAFDEVIKTTGTPIDGASVICDVAVGPENTWSIIDRKRSKVFTYDFEGNLLFAFGDGGELLGNITLGYLGAITYHGTDMLLLDTTKGSFTVYERTTYGDRLLAAIKNQNERRYDEAINDWTEVLKSNSNFDAAYIGMGNALYRNHKYEEAVEQYKNAYDTSNYSTAYSEIRQQWISKYIWTIPIMAVVLCFGLAKLFKVINKINKRGETSTKKRTFIEELVYAFHLILHPFDGFWDLKHEKRGSVRAGTVILVATIAAVYYQSIGAGYVSNPMQVYMTPFGAVITVAVPLALWIIGNWCLTTLFDGEGSFKDIYIASTYSLLPLILTIIPATIASNFVLENELQTVSLITTIGFIWFGLLLFFGMMVTHDYSIGKNFITVLGTVLAMAFIMFLAILFSTLLGKLVGFITSIYTEIKYRL